LDLEVMSPEEETAERDVSSTSLGLSSMTKALNVMRGPEKKKREKGQAM